MKATSLLFVIFACFVFPSFGQFARSVYSDDSPSRRYTSLFSANGETTILSIRESSNMTLRVMLIDIDDKGETDNYRMFEYNSLDLNGSFALSGIGTNSAGEVTLCIIKENQSTACDIHYIKLDPSSGIFSDLLSINGTYRKGYTRSRQKGDSLVTYFSPYSNSSIHRVARSLSSANISTEIATTNGAYSSSGLSGANQVSCDLLIDGSVEYVATASLLVKRSSANSYLETTFTYSFAPPNMCVLSSGELFVLYQLNGNYSVFDSNLSLSNSGNIPELQGSASSIGEIYHLPNNRIRVWKGHTYPSKVVDLTSNFTVESVREMRGEPYDQLKLDGKQYIIGVDEKLASQVDSDGSLFFWTATNITVVYDDLSNNIADFIEFDQVLSSGQIEFHTNHASRSFTNTENYGGFKFEQNGIQRTLMYSHATHILGLNAGSTILGIPLSSPELRIVGPYCSPGNHNHEVVDKYNRGYYVTRFMIETHLVEITSGNPSYEMPFGIREWPAHGDVSLGQAANLAGFVDQNGNGTYEPELGDYPAIYGDQCLLNIYHEHPNTPNSASIETHQYYFTFDCDSSEALKNTVFIRTNNFARSQSLYDAYEGSYADFDIGAPFDDYVGTNVELGMIYGYNGDQFDETNAGNTGFSDTIPAMGVMTLQGMKLDNDGTDNFMTPGNSVESNGFGFDDGIIDNEYLTLESSNFYPSISGPTAPISWMNVMMGLNPDGSPRTLNGVPYRHTFFGNSDPIFYSSFGADHGNNYSEGTSGNAAGDRRMTCASGPGPILTTDTLVLLKAFIVGVDTVNLSPTNSVERLFEHGQNLKNYFQQNATPCGNSFNPYISSSVLGTDEGKLLNEIMVYPNPANEGIQFRGIAGSADIAIYDLNGRMVLSETVVFDDQPIDISPLEKSIYIIHISDENGSQTIRMVKQ